MLAAAAAAAIRAKAAYWAGLSLGFSPVMYMPVSSCRSAIRQQYTISTVLAQLSATACIAATRTPDMTLA